MTTPELKEEKWEGVENEILANKICQILIRFHKEEIDLYPAWKEIKHEIALILTTQREVIKKEIGKVGEYKSDYDKMVTLNQAIFNIGVDKERQRILTIISKRE